jgi:hypothetical protein
MAPIAIGRHDIELFWALLELEKTIIRPSGEKLGRRLRL